MCLVYECVVLVAIALCTSIAFRGTMEGELAGWVRNLYQIYLFLVFGLYFLWCWLRGGQTLPMKTWKIRITSEDGKNISAGQGAIRYLAAWFSLLCLGSGFLWAIFDSDGQFLHDRLAGTRVTQTT